MAREVAIRGEMIRLGALLKLAGLIGAGGEARAFLAEGRVLVNGEPETRRGRQLHLGDEVEAGEEVVRVVGRAEGAPPAPDPDRGGRAGP